MKKEWMCIAFLLLVAGLLFSIRALRAPQGPEVTWSIAVMDGHRTGVVPVNAENVDTALGAFTDEGYVTPSGVLYADDSSVAQVAASLMEVQPKMAYLKEVVGHSAKLMEDSRTEPETCLSNLVVDMLLNDGGAYFKKGLKMDVALLNFGGIRCPLPGGAVTLDDIMSMFPFQNYLAYAQVPGDGLLELFSHLAEDGSFQAVGGVKVKGKGKELVSLEVGGQPVDPKKVYNLITLDFLLDGGDNIRVGAVAKNLTLSRVLMRDLVLKHVRTLEAAGELLDAELDGRVIWED